VVKTNEHIVEQTKQENTLSVERLEHIGRTVRTTEHIVEQASQKNTLLVERSEQTNAW
jgi:hypothetical protein